MERFSGVMAESTVALLGPVPRKKPHFFFFYLKDTLSGVVFQITLTVIGRPKYAAEAGAVEIGIHPVFQSKQQHTYSPRCPPCIRSWSVTFRA